MKQKKQIALYIHIPFCESKCYYCDFNSFSGKNELIEDYTKVLLKEINHYREKLIECEISTVFFGGGTPSILKSNQISLIMESISSHFDINKNAEISIEANPGTLSKQKLQSYRDSGINRLSMGLQSCNDAYLKELGRIHTFEEFISNLEDARKIGFKNINVDLMFALPNMTTREWKNCLIQINKFEIPHISAYSLIWEDGTKFQQLKQGGHIKPIDDDEELEMYHLTIEYLKNKGYKHYEISNYAKKGCECRHNIAYWKNQNYIGLGAGAHSYYENKRFNNANKIEDYIILINKGNSPVENTMPISRADEISEMMFLGLRMTEGIAVEEFVKRFNESPLAIYKNELNKLRAQKLIFFDDNVIKLTQKGIDLSNLVFCEFV
ncbi:MAG: radical SAM family heme chaperone HemW [Alkaliphilus sp.]